MRDTGVDDAHRAVAGARMEECSYCSGRAPVGKRSRAAIKMEKRSGWQRGKEGARRAVFKEKLELQRAPRTPRGAAAPLHDQASKMGAAATEVGPDRASTQLWMTGAVRQGQRSAWRSGTPEDGAALHYVIRGPAMTRAEERRSN
jgi:hypothetical protein